MKKRIFLFSALLTSAAVLLTTVLVTFLAYQSFFREIQGEVRALTIYVESGIQTGGMDYLEALPDLSGHRLTLVAADGSVLYDSQGNPDRMDNHLDRPEVEKAFLCGTGESTRFSDTLREQTYYYAILLENHTVLRVSNTTSSVLSSFDSIFWYVVLIVLVVIALSFLIASLTTKRIVRPINAINLDTPETNVVYDEIVPLVTRIKDQRKEIRAQMKTLERQRREFSAITEYMSEGLLVLDRNANVLSHNKSALRLLDVRSDGAIGLNILALNRSEDFRSAVQSAKLGQNSDCVMALNGRYCQILASPVMDGESLQGIVVLLMDVTEKQEQEKLRREFTANVSHELKTPLTAISGYAEIIMNGISKPEDIPEFSQRIYQESQRLITLVRDLMFLSRLEENAPSQHETVNLLALSQQVAARIVPRAEEQGVTISVSGDPVVVTGIPFVLDEMIYNLLDNAIKYNRVGGSASIVVVQDEKSAMLSVSDTGIGIPKADQNRIFERFYRVDKSRNESIEGTGLGLAIVKHGAILHHAEIGLVSSEFGSCFSLRFPLDTADLNYKTIFE